MAEIEQYSSEDLRLAQRLIRDVGTERTDIAAKLIGELVGRIEGLLTRRREMALPIGYSHSQIEKASKITQSLLAGIDSPEAFLDGHKLMEVLNPKRRREIISRPKGMPELSINRLKELVLAELGQISRLQTDEVPFASGMEPDEKAAINTTILNSWVENSHLKEYLDRKELSYKMMEHKLTVDDYFVGTIIGIFSSIPGTALAWFSYNMFHDPVISVAAGGMSVIAGGIGAVGIGRKILGGELILSGAGILFKRHDYSYSSYKKLEPADISELWDLSDKGGIVRFLSVVNKVEVAQNLNKFIEKH